MTRYVPHQQIYDQAKKYDGWQTKVLVSATILALASLALNSVKHSVTGFDMGCVIDIVNAVASALSVVYIALDLLVNLKFYKAEKGRRVDFIDHAFDTNFSGDRSKGYYNTSGINIGVYRMTVQAFENTLFTNNSAKKMTTKKWIYAIIILVVFLLSACLGEKAWVNNLLQLAAAGILVQQAIKFQQFSDRIEAIHSDFKTLFSNLKDVADKSKNEGEMVRNVLNYETTLSWGSMILDDDIFKRDNDELSKKWEQMKLDYKI